jgi:hypothetical protein
MLGKSRRNKFPSLILFLTLISSCREEVIFNTEILCPDDLKILVRYANQDEIKDAIQRAYFEKKKYDTNTSYTVIKLPRHRSFKIEKISPEKLIKCSLRQSLADKSDKDYIYYH